MMEQGKIDMILSSRPEDRIARFSRKRLASPNTKRQKREALRKLEATEANLLRIGDIIKEVKRQIGSLQRQAERRNVIKRCMRICACSTRIIRESNFRRSITDCANVSGKSIG